MRELLIRYLLGELDHDERQQLQARLKASPELQRELAHLRECFAANGNDELFPAEPPGRLAERTTERVAGYCDDDDDSPENLSRRTAAVAAMTDPPAGVLGWNLADLTVAFGVMLAVSMLIFPALRDSRDGTRRNVCQNNLRQLGFVLAKFADERGRYYPGIGPNVNAGDFTVQLLDAGYVQPEELAAWLLCPAAPLADEFRSRGIVMKVYSRKNLDSMSAKELAVARRLMSPFYAYRLPYRTTGTELHNIKDERLRLPVLADTSGPAKNGFMSPNHGGTIVQVANQDGSVQSLRTCVVPGIQDAFFINMRGRVEAGLNRHDVVLGSSEATPVSNSTALGK